MALPEEVLIKILSYLDVHDLLKFQEAVPEGQHLLSAPRLWVHVDLQRILWIDFEIIDLLQRNASQVHSLALNSPNHLLSNRSELKQVMCQMVDVTYLDLSMCNLISNMEFLVYMRNLQHLVLDSMSILTTDSFIQHLPQCVSLTTLSMKGNPFLTMGEVTDSCKQLTNLRFLDTQGTCDFTPGNVSQILSSCPQMHTFLFNSFYYSCMYRAWIELVNVMYPHVTFHYTTYQQVTRFEKLLAQQIEFVM